MEFRLDQAVSVLRRTPSTLDSLLRDLSDEWLAADEGPDSWTPYDVIGHLLHAEETNWVPRAKVILTHGEARAFEPFDRFAMFEQSKGKSLGDLLDSFSRLRRRSLGELEAMELTPELLEKRGRHPDLGAVTLGQLLAAWVVHDLSHTGQVVRVMARQYGEAVGPWRPYFGLLRK